MNSPPIRVLRRRRNLATGALSLKRRWLLAERLEDRRLLSGLPEAQLFIYQLNSARHDPVAYQLEQGLPIDLSDVEPRQPLAVNTSLLASAQSHASEMATHNYFSHQSAVTGRWPNENARDHGYALPAWWESDANYIESIAAGHATVAATLRQLILSPGHRSHLLGIHEFYAVNREAGVGHAYSAGSTYHNYWAVHLARTELPGTFLTGVVFDDRNVNGRYDLAEGLGGVTVSIGTASTTTNEAGGWSLMVEPLRIYQVTAEGPGFGGIATATPVVETENRQVDFISGRSRGSVDFAPWNDPPHIESLRVDPPLVVPSQPIVLSAWDVNDPDGNPVRVEFYRDLDSNGVLDAGVDELLRVDEDGSDGWTCTVSTIQWASGQHTFLARVEDNDGLWSEVVTAVAEVTDEVTWDTVAPTAAVAVADIVAAGRSSHVFTVGFADDRGVDRRCLTDQNIRVRGPGGYERQATLTGVDERPEEKSIVATYEIAAPGGSWDAADSGHYEIWMLPLQVADLDRNYVRLGRLGTFAVTIDPSQVGEVPDEPAGVVTDDRLEIVHGQLRLRSGKTLATIGAPMVDVVIAVPDTSSPENENPMEIALSVQITAWRNPLDQYDVTGEGVVSPLDALMVITELNTAGGRSLPLLPEWVTITAPFYDVSGDYQLSPLDALLVITRLNRPPEPEGEAEGEEELVTAAEMALVDSQLATIRDDARLWLQPPAAEETRSRFAAHLRNSFSSRRDQSPDRSLVEWEPAAPQVRTGLRGWDRVWGSKKATGDESDVEVLLSEIADDIADAWSHWS